MAHHPRITAISCSACEKGRLAEKTIRHDVGPLLGMSRVMVEHLPALACQKCGAVTVPGAILDAVSILLATLILKHPSLAASEVRYLRKTVGDTQNEFAKRLEVDRATVNRWENSSAPISGTSAYAIRSHVFFRLLQKGASVDKLAPTFVEIHAPTKRVKRATYRIDAASLAA